MNIKLCFLVMMAVCLVFCSCSRFGKTGGGSDVEEIVMDDLTPEEREALLSRSDINLKENKYLAANLSRVEIARDNFGIKVEKQFYNNLPNIKYIAIHTFANGQKQIIIYGENGVVRSLSDTMMAEIDKATPDDLTRDTPLLNNAGNSNSTTGGISITSLPPVTVQSQPLPDNQPPVQTQTPQIASVEKTPDVKPETEVKPQEQPAAKETQTETSTPKNLRGNLQLYPTKKKGER
jgi:hypothetical protein